MIKTRQNSTERNFTLILFLILLHASNSLSSSFAMMMTFIPSILVLHVVDQISSSVRFRFKLVLETVALRVSLLLATILVKLVRLIRPNPPALHLPPLPVPLLVIKRHRLRVGRRIVHVLVHRVTVASPLLQIVASFPVVRRGILLVIIVHGEVLLPFSIVLLAWRIVSRFLVLIILVVELVIPVLVPVVVITATAPIRAPTVLVLLVRSRPLGRHADVEQHRPRVRVVVDHIRHEDLQVEAGKGMRGVLEKKREYGTWWKRKNWWKELTVSKLPRISSLGSAEGGTGSWGVAGKRCNN